MPETPRIRSLVAGAFALAVGAISADFASASPVAPPRPSHEDHVRIIESHSHPSVPDPRLPAIGQDDFDVTNYDLTIAPSVWEARIQGTCAVTFTPAAGVPEVRELVLNLEGEWSIPLWAVTRRSRPGTVIPFRLVNGELRVDLAAGGGPVPAGESETITIRYSGYPSQDGAAGLQFSVFGRFPNHVPSVFTLNEPFRARTWWPCKDTPADKATVTLRVDAPSQWEAVSNGQLVSIAPSTRDGNAVTSWREHVPVPTYAVGFALSDYETCQAQYVSPLDPSVVTPVTLWAWPSRIDQACAQWQSLVPMMQELSRQFGEYPFASEKYDQVAINPLSRNSPFVAMENATATFIGSGWLPLSHDTLMVHELAHHWFGNSVTPTTFQSLWLNEGFATYAEALWWESQYGHGEYLGYMHDLDPLNSTGEFVGSVAEPIDANGDGWPDGDASGSELTVYFKGAWILHMLRWVLGQADQGASVDRIDHVMTEWASQRARANGTTDDFISLADTIATDSFGERDGLQWFFDEWLHRDDRPCYRVGWTAVPTGVDAYMVQLAVEQAKWGLDGDTGRMTCADALPQPYRMPVAVRVDLDGGERRTFVVDSREGSQAFALQVPARPLAVTWDPEGWILKGVEQVSVDADGDGWADPFDSCPLVADPTQRDADGDGLGDACEPGVDFDGDGFVNESDCAPADPGAWAGTSVDAPLDLFVGKSANGLVLWHGDPPTSAPGERAYVIDVAQGRLDRLRANGGIGDAACVQADRATSGDMTIPWSDLPGNRYVVVLPWNGCGPLAPSGVPADPCR